MKTLSCNREQFYTFLNGFIPRWEKDFKQITNNYKKHQIKML